VIFLTKYFIAAFNRYFFVETDPSSCEFILPSIYQSRVSNGFLRGKGPVDEELNHLCKFLAAFPITAWILIWLIPSKYTPRYQSI